VLPPNQAAFAAQAFHAGHAAAWHAGVQTTNTSWRNAAVLELADRYLGNMPEVVIVALRLQTAARRVLISAERQHHAVHRRQIASNGDADLVALRIGEALAHLRYHLLPRKDGRIYKLIGYVPSSGRHLMLPLKFVPAVEARTKEDEWWVQTAIPFGRRELRQAKVRGHLVGLPAGPGGGYDATVTTVTRGSRTGDSPAPGYLAPLQVESTEKP
jgi:hypothetical protein